jgi:hypothetical protein
MKSKKQKYFASLMKVEHWRQTVMGNEGRKEGRKEGGKEGRKDS